MPTVKPFRIHPAVGEPGFIPVQSHFTFKLINSLNYMTWDCLFGKYVSVKMCFKFKFNAYKATKDNLDRNK